MIGNTVQSTPIDFRRLFLDCAFEHIKHWEKYFQNTNEASREGLFVALPLLRFVALLSGRFYDGQCFQVFHKRQVYARPLEFSVVELDMRMSYQFVSVVVNASLVINVCGIVQRQVKFISQSPANPVKPDSLKSYSVEKLHVTEPISQATDFELSRDDSHSTRLKHATRLTDRLPDISLASEMFERTARENRIKRIIFVG